MPTSAVDIIRPAFQHTVAQLFKPFRLGQWVRFAIVGFFAGEMGSCGAQFPPIPEDWQNQGGDNFLQIGPTPALMAVAIVMAILVGLGLVVLLIYISSRMRFVLLDSIVARECRIREFWSRRGEQAFQYFIWQILFALAVAFGFLLLVGGPALFALSMGWFEDPRANLLPLIAGGVVLALILLAYFVLAAIVNVLVKDFVVPQMAFENVSAVEGWRRLWAMMQGDKGGYAVYLLLKIVLAVGVGVLIAIVGFIVFLVLAIPVVVFGILGVLSGAAAGLTWNPVTIAVAIVAGSIVLAVILFISALLSVPAIVFFPAYSVHFFASRYAPLNAGLESGTGN